MKQKIYANHKIIIKGKMGEEKDWRICISEITPPTNVSFIIDGYGTEYGAIKKISWDFGDSTKINTITNRKQDPKDFECLHTFKTKNIKELGSLNVQASVYTEEMVYITPHFKIESFNLFPANHYVHPEQFKQQIVQYYKDDNLTEDLAKAVQAIATRLAFAPNFINYCVDEKTQAITAYGPKSWKTIQRGDRILTFDRKNMKTKWGKILDIFINEHYSGEMWDLRGPGINALVTPDHKFMTLSGLKPVNTISNTEHLILNSESPHRQGDENTIIILSFNKIKIKKIQVKDKVIWCPQTEYGTWVCTRNRTTYITSNTYREEMIGDALIKMFEAVCAHKFDPDKGNPFSYFTKIAFHAFCNRIKREKKMREALSMYQEEVYRDLIIEGIIPAQPIEHKDEENIDPALEEEKGEEEEESEETCE